MKDLMEIISLDKEQLNKYLRNRLKLVGYKNLLTNGDNFIYARGNIPIMLVAHIDTVQEDEPEIYYDRRKQVLWSPDGIGGDDRCGVYAILKIIEKYKPYVLFTNYEEKGCIGATSFVHTIPLEELEDVKFIIEIDRRGKGQSVYYDCDNKKFKEYINGFGFKEHIGSCSDICKISPKFDIASVNLSAGYYNEHTRMEYISFDDLKYTIKKVMEILKDADNVGKFKYEQKKVLYKTWNNYYGLYGNTKYEEEDDLMCAWDYYRLYGNR